MYGLPTKVAFPHKLLSNTLRSSRTHLEHTHVHRFLGLISNKYIRFALKAVMKSFDHSDHPKDWKINQATGNGRRIKGSMKKTPQGVTFWPKAGPYDPLYIRLYLGQHVSIFFACPCSEKAFKFISASDHWNSQTHKSTHFIFIWLSIDFLNV